MEALLLIRETIVKFIKRFEPIITVLLRFALGFYIFSMINDIGHIRPELTELAETHIPFTLSPMVILLAIAFVVLPLSMSYIIMIVNITIQYSASLELAAVIFVGLLCILLFYARMATKESILILVTIVAYHFGLLYLVPLIAGMYFSVTAIIPVAIGIFIIHFTPQISEIMAITPTGEINIAELPETFADVYSAFTNALTNTAPWIFEAFIFAMVIVLVYMVSRLAMDFSREIAIGLGVAVLIFGYILASITVELTVELPVVIVMTLLCGMMAFFIRLFDPILNYSRAESVQFEDDNNYYYVRVVPKIQLTKPNRVVKRIRSDPHEDDDEDDDEGEQVIARSKPKAPVKPPIRGRR